jgi:uncharacterized DUF497 family protein
MKQYDWNTEKNEKLKETRGISFEEILDAINKENSIDILPHPNQDKYPNQEIYAVNIEDYIYLVPFVTSKDIIFLKTIIPSRKATKKYLKDRKNEK